VQNRPLRQKDATFILISRPSLSAIKIKRKGERESPRRIPQDRLKMEEGDSLTRIERKTEEMRGII